MNDSIWDPNVLVYIKTSGKPYIIQGDEQINWIECTAPKVQSTYWPKERNTSKLTNYQLNKLRKNV